MTPANNIFHVRLLYLGLSIKDKNGTEMVSYGMLQYISFFREKRPYISHVDLAFPA